MSDEQELLPQGKSPSSQVQAGLGSPQGLNRQPIFMSAVISAPHNKSRAGFAIGPILYMLMLIGVGAGVLFSGYSQILRSNINVTNNLTVKNDESGSTTTLAATSILGTSGTGTTIFCPPRSDAANTTCNAAPIKMMLFSEVATSDLAKLPTNYALLNSTGTPAEVGVFAAGSGIKQLDPWGRFYLYCRWEQAKANGSNPSFAVISAGPDGTLSTYCGNATTSSGAQGDDLMSWLDVATAIQRSSVWQASSSGSNVVYGNTGTQVTIGADGSVTAVSLAISSTATFTGNISSTGGASFSSLSITSPLPIASGGTGASTQSGARSNLGSGAVGDNLFTATTTLSARTTLGSGAVGDTLFTAASAVAARTALGSGGSGALGDNLFTSSSAATDRTYLGSGVIGDALFLASSTSSAMTALAVPTMGSSLLYASSTSAAQTILGATAVGAALFSASSTAAGRTILGSGAVGDLVFASATAGQALAALGLTGTAVPSLNVNVTGSATSVTGVVPIANGGTGQTTASGALTALGGNNASNLTSGTLSAMVFGSGVITGTMIASNTVSSANMTVPSGGTDYGWGVVDTAGRISNPRVISTNTITQNTSGVTVSDTGTGTGTIYFNTNGTTFMVLTATGSLGLGTLAPAEKLQVSGGNIRISNTAGNSRELQFTTGTNSKRWVVATNSTAEAGSNAGSDFTISAYTDLGATATFTPLTITRSTGNSLFSGSSTFNGSVSSLGGFVGNLTGNVSGTVSGAVGLSDGLVSAPSLYFTNNTNMGLYRPGTSTLGFVTAGTEALRITATQSIGIGKTNPATLLDVNGTVTSTQFSGNIMGGTATFTTVNSTTLVGALALGASATAANPSRNGDLGTGLFSDTASVIEFAISGAETMRLTPFGLGLGSNYPTHKLEIYSNSATTSGTFVNTQIGGSQTAGSTGSHNGLWVSPSFTATAGNTLASLNGIFSIPSNNSTGTITNLYGDYSAPNNASSGTVGNMYGVYAQPTNNAGGSAGGIVTSMVGVAAVPFNASTSASSITSMYGVQSLPTNNNTGNIGSMYALYGKCLNWSSGTITNCYGLYLDTSTGGTMTNRYGIYQVDVGTNNYFAGNLGLGTSTPRTTLDLGAKTDALILTSGTSGQRPTTPVAGMIRYNSASDELEAYFSTTATWSALTATGGAALGGSGSTGYFGSSTAATNPSRSAGEPNTGFYSDASGVIKAAILGSQQWQLTATGETVTNLVATTATFTNNIASLIHLTGTTTSAITSGSGGSLGLNDGLLGAPSLYFSSQSNTGIYKPGTSLMGFVTNGTEAFRISATQSIGINKINPATALDVNGTVTATAFVGSISGTTATFSGVTTLGSINTGSITATGALVGTTGSFSGTVNVAGITTLTAGLVGTSATFSGTLYAATLAGSLATTNLTGTLAAAQFPALTGDITTTAGSLATVLANTASARADIGLGAASSVTFGGISATTATFTGASTFGSVNTGSITATGALVGTTGSFSGTLNVAGITTHTAGLVGTTATFSGAVAGSSFIGSGANITAATLPITALSVTGSASSTTYLRGDGTWGMPSGGGMTNITGDVLASGTGSVTATLANTASARTDIGLGVASAVTFGGISATTATFTTESTTTSNITNLVGATATITTVNSTNVVASTATFTTSAASLVHFTGTTTGAITSSTGGALALNDGLLGAPSLYFSSQSNTGIYKPGTSLMGLVTNGSEALRISATQSVGIGTVTPSTALQVNGTVTATSFAGNIVGTTATFTGAVAGSSFIGSGANITAATLPIASINATGTASSTTYLRGDGTWAAVSGGMTTLNGDISATGTGTVTATLANTATARTDIGLGAASAVTFGGLTTTTATVSGTLTVGTLAAGTISGTYSGTFPTTSFSGTLQAAQFPALTGDITTTAGSLAATLSNTASARTDIGLGAGSTVTFGGVNTGAITATGALVGTTGSFSGAVNAASITFPAAAVAPSTMGVFNSAGTTLNFVGGSFGTNFNNLANTTTLLTILNGGNVGIGTVSPGAALHVFGNNGINGTSAFFSIDAIHSGIAIANNATIGYLQGQTTASGTTANLGLQLAGGYVGIATSTPSTTLTVNGTTTTTNLVVTTATIGTLNVATYAPSSITTSTITATGALVGTTGSFSGNINASTLVLSAYGQVLPINTTTGISVCGQSTGYPNGGCVNYRGNDGGVGGTATNGLEFIAGGSERMRVTATGSVGIGTISPSTLLTINGVTTTTGLVGTTATISGTLTAGTLAVTTFAPASINTGAITATGVTAVAQLFTTATNAYNTSNATAGDLVLGSGLYSGTRHDSSIMMFSAGSAERILAHYGTGIYFSEWSADAITAANVILATAVGGSSYFGGNVGIGTTSPNQKLEVQNAIRLSNSDFTAGTVGTFVDYKLGTTSGNTYTSMQAWNSGGSAYGNIVLNPSGGNVGIGTATPSTALQVNGVTTTTGLVGTTATISGTLTAGTLAVTTFAPASITTSTITATGALVGTTGSFSGAVNIFGNVGIGTTSPISKLNISGGNVTISGYGDPFYSNVYYNSGWVYTGTAVPTFAWRKYATNKFEMVTFPEGTSGGTPASSWDAFVVDTANNRIGIGNASPAYTLDVAGAVNATGFIYGNGKVMFNSSDGYLRINESSWFASGIWIGNSNLMGANGYFAMGSNGGTTSSRVYINGGSYNGTNVINLDGSTGNIYAAGTVTGGGNASFNGAQIGNGITNGFYMDGGNIALRTPGTGTIYFQNASGATTYGTMANSGLYISSGGISFGAANPGLTSGGSYIVVPNSFYISGSGTPFYTEARIQARGGISTDTSSYLSISGGTSGWTYISGSLGIGTTNPIRTFSVNGEIAMVTSGTAYLNVTDISGNNGGSYNLAIRGLASAGGAGANLNSISYYANSNNFNGNVNVGNNGSLSVGSNSSGAPLDIATNRTNDGIAFYQSADNSSTIQSYIDGQWAARTTYAGGCCNVLNIDTDVGTLQLGNAAGSINMLGPVTFNYAAYTNEWYRVNGSTGIYWQSYGGGWYMADSTYMRAYNGKSVMAAGYYHSSDARLKHDIRPFTGSGLAIVDAMRTVRFKWNSDNSEEYGVIAQEVEKVLPDVVNSKSADGMKAVAYDHLVLPVIEAVKELHQLVKDLFARVITLEAKVAELFNRVDEHDDKFEQFTKRMDALEKENQRLRVELEQVKKKTVVKPTVKPVAHKAP